VWAPLILTLSKELLFEVKVITPVPWTDKSFKLAKSPPANPLEVLSVNVSIVALLPINVSVVLILPRTNVVAEAVANVAPTSRTGA